MTHGGSYKWAAGPVLLTHPSLKRIPGEEESRQQQDLIQINMQNRSSYSHSDIYPSRKSGCLRNNETKSKRNIHGKSPTKFPVHTNKLFQNSTKKTTKQNSSVWRHVPAPFTFSVMFLFSLRSLSSTSMFSIPESTSTWDMLQQNRASI